MGNENNKLIESSFKSDPNALIKYLPERFGANISHSSGDITKDYAYSLRAIQPEPKPIAQGHELFPLHGFLGSDWPELLAKVAHQNRDQWFATEYLPKFAQAMAHLHYDHGIYPEGHAQNFQIEIDPSNGKIISFVLRDFADVMIDPYARIVAGKPPLSESRIKAGGSLLNYGTVDRNAGVTAGLNSADYLAQSIMDFEPDFQKTRRWSSVYLEKYIHEVSKITGMDVHSDPKVRKALNDLKTHVSDMKAKGVKEDDLVPYATLEKVVQGVANKVVMNRTASALETHPASQLEYQLIFASKARAGKLAYLTPHGRHYLMMKAVYRFDGQGIIALTPKSGEPFAYAYDLNPREIKRASGNHFTSCLIKGIEGFFIR